MDPSTLNTFRPEYLDAVAAARWNLWLIPVFLSAPFFLLRPVLRRWHWAIIIGLALASAVATWFSLFAYSETIWKTMETHARTNAEMKDVASDTGRVFGPFLLGIPFALFYSAVWVGLSLAVRAIAKRFRRAQPLVPPQIASLLLVATLALAAGRSQIPSIAEKHPSSLVLGEVAVIGSGLTNRIARISGSAERRLTVWPSGEFGIRLAPTLAHRALNPAATVAAKLAAVSA